MRHETAEIQNLLWLGPQSENSRVNANSPSQRGLSRVLGSYRKHRVGPNMFEPTDGYGHGNIGRDTLDEIFADVFQVGKSSKKQNSSRGPKRLLQRARVQSAVL